MARGITSIADLRLSRSAGCPAHSSISPSEEKLMVRDFSIQTMRDARAMQALMPWSYQTTAADSLMGPPRRSLCYRARLKLLGARREVLFDGGVQSGRDVLKRLRWLRVSALGALGEPGVPPKGERRSELDVTWPRASKRALRQWGEAFLFISGSWGRE
jgi:hypothetical protein